MTPANAKRRFWRELKKLRGRFEIKDSPCGQNTYQIVRDMTDGACPIIAVCRELEGQKLPNAQAAYYGRWLLNLDCEFVSDAMDAADGCIVGEKSVDKMRERLLKALELKEE